MQQPTSLHEWSVWLAAETLMDLSRRQLHVGPFNMRSNAASRGHLKTNLDRLIERRHKPIAKLADSLLVRETDAHIFLTARTRDGDITPERSFSGHAKPAAVTAALK
ncbi:MAG: hypothetical protein WDN30_04985 [Pararobbsia sp.]